MDEPSQAAAQLIARIEEDVARQLGGKPKRLAHSRRVAETAVELARAYGVDETRARIAGLLHDYAKAYPAHVQVEKARALGLDFGCELALVTPILHGPIAARELAAIYPELEAEIFQAIERHTVAAADMGPLDMVIYVADALEPGRPSNPGIERLRAAVGTARLDELFFKTFSGSIAYVIETGRFLWPGTVETYNHYVSRRSQRKDLHGIHLA